MGLDSAFIGTFAFIFGAQIGSFLNVVIYRVPRNESIVFPGSRCTSCNKPIRWYDNIPILSYFILRGRCRSCGARFSPRYALVEALTASIALLMVLVPILDTNAIRPSTDPAYLLKIAGPYFAFAAALIAVTFIDLDFQIIPDRISLPGIPVGFAVAMLLNTQAVNWRTSLLGILAGGGALLLVALGYWLVTRREGMGMGDVKLMGMLGAWLGIRAIPFILVAASLAGVIAGIAIMVRGQAGLKARVPFGPFLAGAAVLYLFVGERAIDAYLNLFALYR